MHVIGIRSEQCDAWRDNMRACTQMAQTQSSDKRPDNERAASPVLCGDAATTGCSDDDAAAHCRCPLTPGVTALVAANWNPGAVGRTLSNEPGPVNYSWTISLKSGFGG